MIITTHLPEQYQTLLTLSQRIVCLISEGQWSEVITLTAEYVSGAEALARYTRADLLPVQEQLRPVLRQLLENEHGIKTRLTQRKQELNMMIHHSRRQQSLITTYADHDGQLLVPRDI